jgi:hypothetical protein
VKSPIDMVSKAYTLTPKNVIGPLSFIGDGDPERDLTGVPYKRLMASRIEQAAHLAHTLQDARRHSSDQRRIYGEYVMIPYRPKV